MIKTLALLTLTFVLLSCGDKTGNSIENNHTEAQKEQQNQNLNNNIPNHNEGEKNPENFVPKGYKIHTYDGGISVNGWNEIKGDLNKDGLEDVVLVIKGTDKNKIVKDENLGKLDRNRRGILVLMNKGDHYQLALENRDCFSSENEDGGVYFAPELGVGIEKGKLLISYGHGRYGNWSYTFSYQEKDMVLTAYDLYSSRGPVPQYEVHINFLTNKKLTRDNLNKDTDEEDFEEIYEETWENIKVKKRIRLSEIKDFDALNLD
jgi:hypothetical protein